MAHTHSHADQSTYYLDQLCTIGFCGALGIVQILLWHFNVLDMILVPKFHIPVLLGGIALTLLAVIRAIGLWNTVGQTQAEHAHDHACGHCDEHAHHHHEHDHDHGHEHHEHSHDHDHAHSHGHDHDHAHEHSHAHEHAHDHSHDDCGHDHGWAPWRYVVLLLPILLFLLGMPWPAPAIEDEPPEQGVSIVQFADLEKARYADSDRAKWEGKLVRVRGQFKPGGDSRSFGLFRLKMTCCAADAYPLNVSILSPEPVPAAQLAGQWVNVTGTIKFRKAPGRDEYITELDLRSAKDVRPTSPDPTPFLTS